MKNKLLSRISAVLLAAMLCLTVFGGFTTAFAGEAYTELFSDNFSDLTKWDLQGTKATLASDMSKDNDGTGSMALATDSGFCGSYVRLLGVEGAIPEVGKQYKVSFWYYAEDGAGSPMVDYNDGGEGKAENVTTEGDNTVKGEWTQFAYNFTPLTADDACFRIYTVSNSSAKIYIDNVSFGRVDTVEDGGNDGEVVNLVVDGSFEDGTWGADACERETTIVQDGEASLKHPAGNPAIKIAAQQIAVEPNTEYTLTGWIYRENGEGWAYLDFNDIPGELELDRGMTTANEWVEVSGVWNSGDKTSIWLRTVTENCTGAVYFDNISLVKNSGDEPIEGGDENLWPDGDFEGGATSYGSVGSFSVITDPDKADNHVLYGNAAGLTLYRLPAFAVKPATEYMLSCKAKVNFDYTEYNKTASARRRAWIDIFKDGSNDVPSNTLAEISLDTTKDNGWENFEVRFTTGDTQYSSFARIVSENMQDGDQVWFDDIKLIEVKNDEPVLPDAEYADDNDNTVTDPSVDWVQINNTHKDIENSTDNTYNPNEPAGYLNNDTTKINGSLEFTFTGTKIRVYAPKSLDLGVMNIYLDDDPVVEVDTYADTWIKPLEGGHVWESADLEPGAHTIRLEKANKKIGGADNPSWANAVDVYLDFFEIKPLTTNIIVEGESTVQAGLTTQLSATIYPDYAKSELIWKSSDETIATVDNTGLVSGEAQGDVVITAYATDGSRVIRRFNLHVDPAEGEIKKITNIDLAADKTEIELITGEKVNITATVTPADATNQTLVWASQNPTVATVVDGVVTPVGVGTATITATAQDGSGVVSSIDINVVDNSIEVNNGCDMERVSAGCNQHNNESDVSWSHNKEPYLNNDSTKVPYGEWVEFEFCGTFLQVISTKNSDLGTAKVYIDGELQEGKLDCTGNGYTRQIVWQGSFEPGLHTVRFVCDKNYFVIDSYKYIASEPVHATGITVTGDKKVGVGFKTQLTAAIAPEDATYKTIEWSTSNKNIATVNSNGLVTGVGAGEVTITATAKHDPTVKAEHKICVELPIPFINYDLGNGTFPTDLSGWDLQGDKAVWDGEVSKDADGTGSMKLTNTTGYCAPYFRFKDGHDIDLEVGERYRVSFWYKADEGTSDIQVDFCEHTKCEDEVLEGNPGVKGEWTKIDYYFTPTEIAAPCFRIYIADAPFADGSIWIDNVTFTKVNAQYTPISEIKVLPADQTMWSDETLKMTAVIGPEDAAYPVYTWGISDTDVATISEDGIVTPVKAGKVTVYAYAQDGTGVVGSTTLTIEQKGIEVTDIEITAPKEMLVGQDAILTAKVLPENAAEKGVTWQIISGKAYATIDANGKLVAKLPGTIKVAATAQDVSATMAVATITIKEIKATNVFTDPTEMTLTYGKSAKIASIVLPIDASFKELDWTSSNASVASVEDGVVTALAVGKTVITAQTIHGVKAEIPVTVKPASVSTVKMKLAATLYTYDGKVKKPAVTVTDANGKKVSTANYTVKYASGRKVPGTYIVKVTMKGNYTGSKTLMFSIRGKKMAVSKLTALSKGFKATWKKQSYVTGYQVQYSTSSKFTTKTTKHYTINKYTTTYKTVTKLKGNTKYYVRVRSYKTTKIGGKRYNVYSAWSKAKAVKTKR